MHVGSVELDGIMHVTSVLYKKRLINSIAQIVLYLSVQQANNSWIIGLYGRSEAWQAPRQSFSFPCLVPCHGYIQSNCTHIVVTVYVYTHAVCSNTND